MSSLPTVKLGGVFRPGEMSRAIAVILTDDDDAARADIASCTCKLVLLDDTNTVVLAAAECTVDYGAVTGQVALELDSDTLDLVPVEALRVTRVLAQFDAVDADGKPVKPAFAELSVTANL